MTRMSFAMTIGAVRNRTKTVTRRLGWANVRVGDVIEAVTSSVNGETLARLRVVSVRQEPLDSITKEDVSAEGYPDMSAADFVAKFCAAMKCEPRTLVRRIEFEYVEPLAGL